MSFQINDMGHTHTFAEGEISHVRGLAGVGFYRLAVDLKFVIDPLPEPSPRITSLVADVMGPGGRPLGRALPDPGQLPIPAYKFVQRDRRVTLTFDLDQRRMEAIEDLRNGGDLQLSLNVYSTLEDPSSELSQQQAQESTTVNQGLWVKVLEQLGYVRRILLEVDLPDPGREVALAKAVGQLQRAQGALAQGEYREAVAACRDVLEEVSRALKDDRIQLNGKDQRDWDKAERLLQLRRALRVVTHPAKHRDEVSAAIEWTRRDAISIVTMTSAVIVGLGAEGARPSIAP